MTYGSYGVGLTLVAVGAIVRWAVTGHVSGLALQTIGLIVLLAGVGWLAITALQDYGQRRAVVADPNLERDRVRAPY